MRKAWLGPGLWVTSWGLWWCKEAHTGEVAEAGYPALLYPNSVKRGAHREPREVVRGWWNPQSPGPTLPYWPRLGCSRLTSSGWRGRVYPCLPPSGECQAPVMVITESHRHLGQLPGTALQLQSQPIQPPPARPRC